MIRHSVILKLKEGLNQELSNAYFNAVHKLASIPDVQQFEVLKQISPKNKFEYGISMEFENQEQYDAYSNHPLHTAFLKDYWIPCVEDFLEIDYTLL